MINDDDQSFYFYLYFFFFLSPLDVFLFCTCCIDSCALCTDLYIIHCKSSSRVCSENLDVKKKKKKQDKMEVEKYFEKFYVIDLWKTKLYMLH